MVYNIGVGNVSRDFRRGRHVVSDLHAHIVLTPKYRRGVITTRVRELLVETTREVCERWEVTLDAVDGTDDHLHLLISYPPKVALASLVGAIKTAMSKTVCAQRWPEIQKALWGDHFWSPSYCVVSTGGAPLQIVQEYVENQRAERDAVWDALVFEVRHGAAFIPAPLGTGFLPVKAKIPPRDGGR